MIFIKIMYKREVIRKKKVRFNSLIIQFCFNDTFYENNAFYLIKKLRKFSECSNFTKIRNSFTNFSY